METKATAQTQAIAGVSRKRGVEQAVASIRGWFYIEQWRDGECIHVLGSKEYDPDNHNVWCYEGINPMMQGALTGTPLATIQPVYVGFTLQTPPWTANVNSAFDTTPPADNPNAQAQGWTEWTGYTPANRPQWLSGGFQMISGSLQNTSVIVVTASGAATVDGAFTATASSGTTAPTRLLSEQKFTQPAAVLANGDDLRVTYVMSITST